MKKGFALLDLQLRLYHKILLLSIRGATTLVIVDIILPCYLRPRKLGIYQGFEISYSSVQKIFTFKDLNSRQQFKPSYPLDIPKFPNTEIQKFGIHSFKRHQTIENKILQVCLEQERVGWIFPIGALESIEHDFANNKHFLNYAKAAFVHLKIKNPDSDSLLESYGSKIHIFCYSKERVENLDITFDITQYFHCFYLNGYHPDNQNQEIKIIIEYPDNKLILKKYSKKILNIGYIKKIFNEVLPYIDDPLLEFFYQYQIIELLIDQVFSYSKNSLIEKLSESDLTGSEVREILDPIISEKKRINKLANDFTAFSQSNEKNELRQYCNGFLKKNKLTNSDLDNLEEYLYKLRNSLFHSHFKITEYEGLDTINKCLRACLVNMITDYKEPSSS